MQENIQDTNILEYGFRYCACDCGKVIKAVDSKGREVRFVCGHNRRKSKGTIRKEVDKITDIYEARDIIKNQYKIICDLQQQLEWKEDGRKDTTRLEDNLTPELNTGHS